MNKTIPKSYLSSFVLTSTILFAVGALATTAGLYLVLRDEGMSYADNFRLLADLNRGLVDKSLLLFVFTLLLSIAGILVIAIAYSHRVAGPLYKLGLHTRKIASGDLTEPVHLRNADVLHVLADDLNELSARYRDLLAHVELETRELAALMDEWEKEAPGDGDPRSHDGISERIDTINKLLNRIKV